MLIVGVYIYFPAQDFAFWVLFSMKKNQGSLEKWMIPGLRQGKYKSCQFYSN